jgi:hypothetical protein
VRLDRGASRGDAQRQRQSLACVDNVGHGGGLGRQPLLAQAPFQQQSGVAAVEHVQPDRMRAVGDDQAGEPVPAGHDHGRGRGTRKQSGDLIRITGIVQHDQHAAHGDQAPVQPDLGVYIRRYPVRRHAEGVEEHPQSRLRQHRLAG